MRVPLLVLGSCLALLAANWGCDERGSIPELPEEKVQSLDPVVAAHLAEALAAARANPRDIAPVGDYALVLHTYRQHLLAAEVYELARALEPDKFRWSYYRATALEHEGMTAQALPLLREALEQRPDYVPGLLRLAELLIEAGQHGEAREVLRDAAEHAPRYALLHFRLGQTHLELGTAKAGIAALRRAVKLDPRFGSAHYALALALRDAGELEAAERQLEIYELHKENEPSFSDPLTALIWQRDRSSPKRLKRARQLKSKGDTEGAIAELNALLEADPNYLGGHAFLLSLHRTAGNLDAAEEHYRKAMAINPDGLLVNLEYGRLLFQQHRYEEAAEVVERVLEINPNRSEGHVLFGLIRERQERPEEAGASYEKALELDQDDASTRFRIARLEIRNEDLEEAKRHFERALSGRPSAARLQQVAKVYADAGLAEEAVHYFERALAQAVQTENQDLRREIEPLLADWRARRDGA